MEYADFVGQVQREAGAAGQEEAATLTIATLQTLSERLRGDRDNLFAELPQQLTLALVPGAGTASADIGLDEFLRKVSQRAMIAPEDALGGARAVLLALQSAMSQGAFRRLRAQLPQEYDALFRVSERERGR